MLTRYFAAKLATCVGLVVIVLFTAGQDVADAKRTQYDTVWLHIKVNGCNGSNCAYYDSMERWTVNNQHWVDYHYYPYKANHPDGHGDNQRFVFHLSRTITLETRCDGTDCPG